ncbi:hypothetical protein [Actinoplanes sp. NPDC051411]|uniref:ATP dependent DNA ligase n=1 Tax=Actinoplanes sp. NPDC051411 TaxID=3155522 RepID=UPI003448F1F6
MILIGWKPGEGRRAGTIGSLLLAVYDQNDLLAYAGHVGTGFTELALRQLQQQLAPIARSTPAVGDVPREHARHAHWVEPALIGEVTHRTWTPENRLRHASWRGLRTDRSPSSARRSPAPIPVPSQGQVEGAYRFPDDLVCSRGHRRCGVGRVACGVGAGSGRLGSAVGSRVGGAGPAGGGRWSGFAGG